MGRSLGTVHSQDRSREHAVALRLANIFHLAEDARKGNRDLTTAGYPGNVGKRSAKPYFPHTRHSLVFEQEARQ
jgi:hypothetical protein